MHRAQSPPLLDLRLCDPDDEDAYGAFFPHILDLGVEDDLLDLNGGGGSFTYPRGDGKVKGVNANLLEIRAEVALLHSGVEVRNSRFDIQAHTDDVVGEGDDALAVVTWQMTPLLHRFAQVPVMPRLTDGLAKTFTHVNETAGAIFLEHFHRAKNDYGMLAGINADFTAELDSNGAAWDQLITVNVDVGTPLLNILGPDFTLGYVEAYCHKRTLHVVNAGSGVDWTADQGPGGSNVCLMRGLDLLDGPRVRDGNKICTHVIVQGDGGKYVIVDGSDDDIARFGHIYTAISARGVTDLDTLRERGEAYLALNHRSRDSITYGVALGFGHDPYEAYKTGDWIYTSDQSDVMPQRYRVRKINTVYTPSSNQVTALLTVNDWFDEHEIDLQRRIDGMTNGSDGVAGGAVPNVDRMAPAPPTWAVANWLVTDTYPPPAGVGGGNRAEVTATVILPTTDEDGSPLYDYSHLIFEWKYAAGPGWIRQSDPDGVATIRNLDPGRSVLVRVVTVDTHGNESDPTEARTITAATDYGAYTSYDSTTGELLFDTANGERAKAPRRFTIGQVPGGALDATTNGIMLDEADGLRTWNPTGDLTVHIDAATGDLTVAGNLNVSGTTVLNDDTTINDTLTVHADATFDGDLDVGGVTHLGGALFLDADLDASGHRIVGGELSTGSDAIVIAGTTINIGSTTIEYSSADGWLAFSTGAGFGGGITVNGEVVSDAATLGVTRTGKFGANGTAASSKVVLPAAATDAATTQTLANAIRSLAITFGLGA